MILTFCRSWLLFMDSLTTPNLSLSMLPPSILLSVQ